MKKKLGILFLICILMCTFCSCNNTIERHGLENYTTNLDYGIGMFGVLDDMIEANQYADGDYYLYWDARWDFTIVKTFTYLQYDIEAYEQAKEYMLTNMNYDTAAEYAEQGYMIYQAYTPAGYDHPVHGAWIGFNDSARTLYFFDIYNALNMKAQAVSLYEEGFDKFLLHYYGEYYDFGI